MNTTDNSKSTTANNDSQITDDALAISCSVRLYGRDETIMDFTGRAELPMALREASLASTADKFGPLLEMLVVHPAGTALMEHLTKLRERYYQEKKPSLQEKMKVNQEAQQSGAPGEQKASESQKAKTADRQKGADSAKPKRSSEEKVAEPPSSSGPAGTEQADYPFLFGGAVPAGDASAAFEVFREHDPLKQKAA